MAKIVKKYGIVECLDVGKFKEGHWDDWRKKYIGETGNLNLCEHEHALAGKQFLSFEGGDLKDLSAWYLDTSPGELVEDGDKIIFITKNTRYVFELRTE